MADEAFKRGRVAHGLVLVVSSPEEVNWACKGLQAGCAELEPRAPILELAFREQPF